MNIDVSVRRTVLASAIRNRITAIPVCIDQSLTGFLDGMVVDRLGVDEPELTRVSAQLDVRTAGGGTVTVSGHRVRATFPVHVHTATRAALAAAGTGVPSTVVLHLEVRFDLVGELTLDDDGNVIGAGIRTTYAGKNVALPDPALDAQVETALDDAGQFAPIDLGGLSTALGAGAAIRNVGVALGDEALVVRLQVGSVPADAVPGWTSFFADAPNWLADRDWAIFVDQSLVCQAVETRLAAEMATSVEKGDLEILEAPSALWMGWTGVPLVQVQAYVDVVGKCPSGFDIGVEVTANTVIDLVDGPALSLDNEIFWNVVDSDSFLCGFTSGLFSATIGAVLGAAGGPVGAAVGAWWPRSSQSPSSPMSSHHRRWCRRSACRSSPTTTTCASCAPKTWRWRPTRCSATSPPTPSPATRAA